MAPSTTTDPATGPPVGLPVAPSPAGPPQRSALAGRPASAVPPDAERHTDALYAGLHGAGKDELRPYLPDRRITMP